jgi:hypothetical protein
MCNKLHDDSQPIPEKGIGYKLMLGEGRLPLVNFNEYEVGHDKWIKIKWKYKWDQFEGFCFFLNLQEAEKAGKAWADDDRVERAGRTELWKIEYDGGLGAHKEHGFIGDKGWNIALCAAFRLVECIEVF